MKYKTPKISRPGRRALPVTALASALLLALVQLPAVAGDVCRHADGTDSSTAVGAQAFACGDSNEASGMLSSAFGILNKTGDGLQSSASGFSNEAYGGGSAFGAHNNANGASSSASGIENSGTAAEIYTD